MVEIGVDEAISYVFVWHALTDACQKCRRLNGKEFHDQDLFQDVLWDSIEGNIWDLNADHSLTHPHCRCQLEVRTTFDWNRIREIGALQNLLQDSGLPRPEFKSIEEVFTNMSEARNQVKGLKDILREITPELKAINQEIRMYFALADESGLPRNLVQAVRTFEMTAIAAERAYRSIMLLSAATGPFGWLFGLASFAVSTVMLVDQIEIRRPRY